MSAKKLDGTKSDMEQLGRAVQMLKMLGTFDENAGVALGVKDGTLDKYLIAELDAAQDNDNHPLSETLEWAVMGGAEQFHIDPSAFTVGVMIGFVRGLGYANRENGIQPEE